MHKHGKLEFRPLSDKATHVDELKSHSRIADSIADLIARESTGISVALTGSWGVGKSSIVRMMQLKLPSNVLLFNFDAWAHKGDPLRRSFLEQLICFLMGEDWIRDRNKRTWNRTKDVLSKKVKETHTSTRPLLKFWGILFSLSLLFVPLGIAWITVCENITYWDFWPVALSPMIGIILLLYYGLLYLRKSKGNREDVGIGLAVLTRDAVTDTKSRTVQAPDPTSIEFLEIYHDLLNEVFANKDRKLVIVIDNLDRVGARDALKIWATMRTFFDVDTNNNGGHQDRVWLIVPFDERALSRLWPETGQLEQINQVGEESEESNVQSKPISQNGYPLRQPLAQSFSQKTFQVTFAVPPPILTNWKEFFVRQMKHAFPGLGSEAEEDIYIVYRIYERFLDRKGEHPTPRDIKLFINNLGALCDLHSDQIHLRVLALYVTLVGNDFDFLKFVRGDADYLPEKSLLGVSTDEARQQIAAVYFGVPIDEAMQVALGPLVREAIRSGETRELERIQGYTGFVDVLQLEVEGLGSSAPKTNGTLLMRAASIVGKILPPETPSTHYLWTTIKHQAMNVPALESVDAKVAEGIETLIEKFPETEFAESILTAVSNTDLSSLEIDGEGDEGGLTDFTKSIVMILKAYVMKGHQNLLEEKFRIHTTAKTYLVLLASVSSLPQSFDILKYCKYGGSLNDIIQEFVALVEKGEWNSDATSVLEKTLLFGSPAEWEAMLLPIQTRLDHSQDVPAKELRQLLESLNALCKPVDKANQLKHDLVEKGHLPHHLARLNREKHINCIAMLLLTILEVSPDLRIPPKVGNSGIGIQICNDITANPDSDENTKITDHVLQQLNVSAGLHESIEKWLDAPTLRVFSHALIRRISRQKELLREFTPQVIIDREADLFEAVGDLGAYYNLIAAYGQASRLAHVLIDNGFDISKARVYIACHRRKKRNTLVWFDDFLSQGLLELREEDWTAALNDQVINAVDLTVALSNSHIQLNLVHALRKALARLSEGSYLGSEVSRKAKESWSSLVSSLSGNDRLTLIRDTIDRFLPSAVPSFENIVALYGDSLIECEVLEESARADGIIRKADSFCDDQERISELEWFKNVLDNCPRVSKKAKTSSVQAFRSTLATLRKRDLDAKHKRILDDLSHIIDSQTDQA